MIPPHGAPALVHGFGMIGTLAPHYTPHPVWPLTPLKSVSLFSSLLNYPPIKALLPIPILAAIAPALWWFFRDTWRRLDVEAAEYRAELSRSGRFDYRPIACFCIVGVVLTLQEYYGGSAFYAEMIRPWLSQLEAHGHHFIKLAKYDEYYGYCWWSLSRVVGYVFIPLPLWKLLFPGDSLLDMGFRTRGFFRHIWIYLVCLAFVMPALLVVSHQPDFSNYYPFYKNSSRSWFDLLIWEGIYFAQFLSLETFFRGWMVGALRHTMGSGAIFAMAVPYCMIHYGKPYFEANGAIVAGVVLGSLAMRTRSIYAGFLVHVTVAFSMDFLALYHRGALPHHFWAPG